MTTKNTLKQRTGNDSSFYIEELPDNFRLHNVPYGDGLAVLTWDKEYLGGGRTHNQREWLRMNKKVPDILAYHATITSLAQNTNESQSSLVKKVSRMFQIDFGTNLMATSTRLQYRSKSPDSIIHWYKTEEQRIVEVPFVGPGSSITAKSGLEEQMEALLGTRNLQEIENSYSTFSGKKPYLWRVKSRPTQDTERAVWVYFGAGGFDLNCSLNPIILLGRARGVRVESA